MAEEGKIIFTPEFDLSKLNLDAESAKNRLLLLYKEVEQLGKVEKQRFVSQLGVIEQLQLREQRLIDLRRRANSETQIVKFNKAITDTQTKMQSLEKSTTGAAKSTGLFTQLTGKANETLVRLAGTIGTYFAASQLIGFFEKSIALATQENKEFSQLAFQLQRISGYSDQVTQSFKRQAQQQGGGLFSADTIARSQKLLVQFGLIPEQIQKAIPILQSFAVATDRTLEQATDVFINAIKGRDLELKKYSIIVDATASATVRFDQATSGLSAKFKDAEEGLDQMTLSTQKAKVAFDDFLTSVGQRFTNSIGNFITTVNAFRKGTISISEFLLDDQATLQKIIREREASLNASAKAVADAAIQAKIASGYLDAQGNATVESITKEIADVEEANRKLSIEITKLINNPFLVEQQQALSREFQANAKHISDLKKEIEELKKLNIDLSPPKDPKIKIQKEVEIALLLPHGERARRLFEAALPEFRKFIKELEDFLKEEADKPLETIPVEVAPLVLPDPGLETRLNAFLEKYNDTYAEIVDIALGAFSQILAGEIALNEAQIRIQSTRVDQALKIAERGNAEYLQREQERLDALQRKQESFAKQQAVIAQITALANIVAAVASAAAQSGILSPIAIATVIGAIAAGIGAGITLIKSQQAGFKEGGYTGEGAPDDVAGVTHKREFVFDEDITGQNREVFEQIHKRKLNLRGMMDKARSYDMIQAKINTGKISDLVVVHNQNSVDLASLNDKLDEVIYAIRSRKEASVNITKEGIGIVATEYITNSNKLGKLAS